MILLIDADSLVFSSCYTTRSKYFTDINLAIAKFEEVFHSILNNIEETHIIAEYKVFNNAKGNFRKLITPVYKANRSDVERPPLLEEMHDYVTTQYNSVNACGVETDDVVARYWYEISSVVGRESVMIVTLDKDYKQFPCLYYNYHHQHSKVIQISESEARYNFYEQMIAGDTADNVNYFPGKGVKFAQKYFADCETDFQYRKKFFILFKKKYKSKAKEKYAECYNLLKLRTK